MKNRLKELLIHPLIRHRCIDAPETVGCVDQIIQSKPFLKKLYTQWYTELAGLIPEAVEGPILELGSGAGCLENHIPRLIKSEILQTQGIDIVLDAKNLPVGREKLSGIVMVDVLHHLSDAESFFKEASYCIKPKGRIIMLEPWVTCWSKFIYTKLHHEPFDDKAEEWKFPEGGALSQANSALPWIIFHRDKSFFERKFPDWAIQKIRLHTPFAYLVSGGVSLRSFLPNFSYWFVRKTENAMNPWINKLAMFATIHLQRKP